MRVVGKLPQIILRARSVSKWEGPRGSALRSTQTGESQIVRSRNPAVMTFSIKSPASLHDVARASRPQQIRMGRRLWAHLSTPANGCLARLNGTNFSYLSSSAHLPHTRSKNRAHSQKTPTLRPFRAGATLSNSGPSLGCSGFDGSCCRGAKEVDARASQIMTAARYIALTASLLLQACERRACPTAVSMEQYADLDRCWGGVSTFSARVAFTLQSDGAYQPTFISNECYLAIAGAPKWSGIAEYPRLPQVSGDSGVAKARGMLERRIAENHAAVHLAGPKDTSRIYMVTAVLQQEGINPRGPVFRIADISKLVPTGKTMRDVVSEPCYR
jgi:hypothetical protein